MHICTGNPKFDDEFHIMGNYPSAIRCRDALPILTKTLDDDDQELRCRSIRALGEIGDHQSIPHLIPLLGDGKPDTGGSPSEAAYYALKKLGLVPSSTRFLTLRVENQLPFRN
jgi:HEAT repeat protein